MARGPLAGVRIVDLTRVWAGPLGTRILADLGADVIKVEAPTGRGPARARPGTGYYPDGMPGERPWNRQGSFNKLNRNKRSLVLDLKHGMGREVFLRLVALSDVVVENFSAGTMEDLGLEYAALCQANPGVIYVSMPGFGSWGPYRDYVAYGPSIEPMTGFPYVFGYGDGPHVTALALPDATAGTVVASAVLTALWRQADTGRGAHVDVSQHEGFIPFFAGEIVAAQQDPAYAPRPSNRSAGACPHGVFRCRGEDQWVTIAVEDEHQWATLSSVAGRGWEHDPRYRDADGRRAHEDQLEAAIQAWTMTQGSHELAGTLRSAGVPAAAVLDGAELVAEPHLRARRFFVELDHPDVGTRPYPGAPVLIDGERHVGWRSAPMLGEHNEQILRDLLGYREDEVADLREANVIADRPTG